MSLFNNLKREIKNKKKYFILTTIFILIYSLAFYFMMYSVEDKSVINIISTLNGQGGMAGAVAFIYLYTPILFFGINSHIKSSEKESFLIKMKNRKNIFNSHVFFVIALSIIITTIIICLGYCIGGVYASGFENLWPKNDPLYASPQYGNLNVLEILNSIPIYMVILKTFILKFMGLSIVGFFILNKYKIDSFTNKSDDKLSMWLFVKVHKIYFSLLWYIISICAILWYVEVLDNLTKEDTSVCLDKSIVISW